jgi:hypothetical protein
MSAMLAMTAIASSVGALQYPSLRCFTRRHMIAGALSAIAGVPPCFAEESSSGGTYSKVGSERPGNNYYFPMARYRYCPRILRAWIAVDELGLQALKERRQTGPSARRGDEEWGYAYPIGQLKDDKGQFKGVQLNSGYKQTLVYMNGTLFVQLDLGFKVTCTRQ